MKPTIDSSSGQVWNNAQGWEKVWWSNCIKTSFGEELKQLVYAERMGLKFVHDGKTPYTIPCNGKSILDIGGGPSSLLLKVTGASRMVVADPLEFPLWVYERYRIAGIEVLSVKGEDLHLTGFDECWIYNTLQHTEDPRKIILNAQRAAKVIRIFEWIDMPVSPGHLYSLKKEELDTWLGGEGQTDILNNREKELFGKCYYGAFETGGGSAI